MNLKLKGELLSFNGYSFQELVKLNLKVLPLALL